MQQIFGDALFGAPAATPPPARTPDAVVPLIGETGERWPRWLIGMAVTAAAGVLLLSGAVWMMRDPAPAAATAQPTATPAAPRAIAISAQAPAPVALTGPVAQAAPSPAPKAGASRPAATRKPPTVPAKAAVAEPAPPAPRAIAVATPSVPAVPPLPRCDGLQRKALAHCMYPRILAADQRLRDAFGAAARAGVDTRSLRDYRQRWTRLSKRADSDPDRVVVGYRELAGELDTARTRL